MRDEIGSEKKPVVTVIVQHHLDENRPYLDLCLKALATTKGIDYEALVIADSETKPVVPDGMRLIYDQSLNTATKKVHLGIEKSHPGSRYFLILSDDVVIGEQTIARLVRGIGDNDAICNPMSNSDNGGQFIADMPCACETSPEELKDDPLVVANAWGDAFGGGVIKLMITKPYVCFYCTLIPRTVWERVGGLDDRLENRHNDQDYCIRAAMKGIPSAINFGTFALHFGSKTLNKVAPEALRDEASKVFVEKWKGIAV